MNAPTTRPVWLLLIALEACQSSTEPALDVTNAGPEQIMDAAATNPVSRTPDDARGQSASAVTPTDALDAGRSPQPIEPEIEAADGGGPLATEADTDAVVWPPPLASSAETAMGAEARFERYAACLATSSCASVSNVGVDGYDVSTLRCMLEALGNWQSGLYTHVLEAPESTLQTILQVHPQRLVEVLTSEQRADDPAQYSIPLLCFLAEADFFQSCLAELPEDGAVPAGSSACLEPSNWFLRCTQVVLPEISCSQEG